MSLEGEMRGEEVRLKGQRVREVGWTTAAVSNTRGFPVNYALCRGGFNISNINKNEDINNHSGK